MIQYDSKVILHKGNDISIADLLSIDCKNTWDDNNVKKLEGLVGTSIFKVARDDYFLICDSYSGYYEFEKLNSIISLELIGVWNEIFSVHVVPKILDSDKEP